MDYNTCQSSSDNQKKKTVIYHLKLSSSSDENCMLNELCDYKEIDFDFILRFKSAESITSQIKFLIKRNIRHHLYYLFYI